MELDSDSTDKHYQVSLRYVSAVYMFVHYSPSKEPRSDSFFLSFEWQKDKKYGLSWKYQIGKSDIELAIDLVAVLQPLLDITLQVSLHGSPCLLHVVVFIDQITKHLSTIIAQKLYAPVLRNACCGGLQLTNKYYTLTNCSPLYRVAMSKFPFHILLLLSVSV
jgi:hypothetical protein